MDTFFAIIKKILVGTTFVLFAFTAVYIPSNLNHINEANAALSKKDLYKIAAAAVPTGVASTGNQMLQLSEETRTAISESLSAVTNAITAAATFSLNTKETILDAIAWAVAKRMVAKMTKDVVDWINNGFDGRPAFISDMDRFMGEVIEEEMTHYVNEIAPFLCSPFKIDVQTAVKQTFEESKRPLGDQGCSLNNTVLNNIDDFMSGTQNSFGKLGWEGWFEITAKPQSHTPYGATLTAKNIGADRLEVKKDQEKEVLGFGDGFLSGKVCETTSSGSSRPFCSIVKPGQVIVEALNKNLDSERQTLVVSDEINEITVSLFNAIATKVLSSKQGLLGESRNTQFTQTDSSGNTGLDQLVERNQLKVDSRSTQDRLSDLVDTYKEYLTITEIYEGRLIAFKNETYSNTNILVNEKIITQDIQPAIEDLKQIKANLHRHLQPEYNPTLVTLRNDLNVIQNKKALGTATPADLIQETAIINQITTLQPTHTVSSATFITHPEDSTRQIISNFTSGDINDLIALKTELDAIILKKTNGTDTQADRDRELDIIELVSEISPQYTKEEVVNSRNQWEAIIAEKRINAFTIDDINEQKVLHYLQTFIQACAVVYKQELTDDYNDLVADGAPQPLIDTVAAAINNTDFVIQGTTAAIPLFEENINEAIDLDVRWTADKFKLQTVRSNFDELLESDAAIDSERWADHVYYWLETLQTVKRYQDPLAFAGWSGIRRGKYAKQLNCPTPPALTNYNEIRYSFLTDTESTTLLNAKINNEIEANNTYIEQTLAEEKAAADAEATAAEGEGETAEGEGEAAAASASASTSGP